MEELYKLPSLDNYIRDNGIFKKFIKMGYLSDFVTRQDILNIHNHKKNTMILSPCGSGKSHFVINQILEPFETMLILTDTTTLKKQHMKDISKLKDKDYFDVMTYAEFGTRLSNCNYREFIEKNAYDFIVCDEVHNLIDYSMFDIEGDKSSLERAKLALFEHRDFVKVIYLTATPKLIFDLDQDKYISLLSDTYKIDLLDVENIPIQHYINKCERIITHTSQVKYELESHINMFKYRNEKCAIFCPNITQMKSLEKQINQLGLKAILIFSENAIKNNPNNILSQEAKDLRQCIINSTKENPILDIIDFDILLFNRAMETGVNIYDNRFKLFICCTSDPTQTYQARSRFRMDMEFVTNKTKQNNIPLDTYIDISNYENKPLTNEDIKQWAKSLDITKNDKGAKLGAKDLVKILEHNHIVTKKIIRIEGKQTRVIVVTRKPKDKKTK